MRPLRWFVLGAAVTVVALTACDRIPHVEHAGLAAPNVAAGRNVFVQAGCGACHTLRDAGSTGTFAPNLDRLRPTVVHVKEFVSGGGVGMPSFTGLLTDGEIQAVSEYVHTVAGY
jgi:mono/diheme cytochrome c family protein